MDLANRNIVLAVVIFVVMFMIIVIIGDHSQGKYCKYGGKISSIERFSYDNFTIISYGSKAFVRDKLGKLSPLYTKKIAFRNYNDSKIVILQKKFGNELFGFAVISGLRVNCSSDKLYSEIYGENYRYINYIREAREQD